MNYKKTTTTYKRAFFFILLSIFSFHLFASSHEEEKSELENKEFDLGSFIIDHILDAHEWHLFGYKDKQGNEKHVSIPLPVILFDNGKPVVFLSNKFHHGESSYKGYALGFTENTKKKIVKLGGEYEGKTAHITEDMAGSIVENSSWFSLIDISLTKNVCSLFLSIGLIIWLFLHIANRYKKNPCKTPKGLQSIFEVLILFVRDDIAKPSIGEKKYEKYLPYLLTLFFFIFFNNVLGLIPLFPGGANVTGNIAVTATLALITFFITLFVSNKNYWKHIFNTPGVPWWVKIPLPLLPLVEFMGVLTKPFVLMVRLFANILGGHVIAIGLICLIFVFGAMAPAIGYGISVVSIFFYLFMGLLEIIVAFVQAFVFTLLSAIYIGMAMEEHHEEKVPHQPLSVKENS